MRTKKVVKEKIFYKEGQVMLIDGMTVFHFKDIHKCYSDDYFIEIIDMYDNLIKIPYRQIKYVFRHANNQVNKGGQKLG